MKRVASIFILTATLFHGSVLSQTPDDAFKHGNDFYRAGQFEKAAAEYESILNQEYASAELYFNLGNAYYRSGKIARAVLAYERASRLRTNDPDIRYNLRLATQRTVDRIESVPELLFIQWVRAAGAVLSLGTTASFFSFCWVLFFGSLAAVYVVSSPGLIKAARWMILLSGLLLVVFGGMLWIQNVESRAHDSAIVVAQVVTAKSSPDDQSVDAFVIHEGLKVKISDSVGDWVKITLADGKVGWIQSQQCERI